MGATERKRWKTLENEKGKKYGGRMSFLCIFTDFWGFSIRWQARQGSVVSGVTFVLQALLSPARVPLKWGTAGSEAVSQRAGNCPSCGRNLQVMCAVCRGSCRQVPSDPCVKKMKKKDKTSTLNPPSCSLCAAIFQNLKSQVFHTSIQTTHP